MNPWWKRPSSESSSSASRSEAERRSRSKSESRSDGQSNSDGDKNGGETRRPRMRRGGPEPTSQPGGRGRRKDNPDQSRASGSSRRGSSRRGGRRGGRRRGPRPQSQVHALLVDVEALHKHIKDAGGNPEEAGALFKNIGEGTIRRAVASGTKKRKVQDALRALNFDIEQVRGTEQDARLRLALDAMELTLGQPGVKLFMLRHKSAVTVLGDRLRHHGAEVTFFSSDEPPAIEPATDKTCAKSSEQTKGDSSEDSPVLSDNQQSSDQQDQKQSDRGPRRRRAGRRRGPRNGEGADAQAQDNTPSPASQGGTGSQEGTGSQGVSRPQEQPKKATNSIKPMDLLCAAIDQLVKAESQLVWATKVRQEMSAVEPLFNEADHGYDNFEALLKEAERRGRVVLQKDPRTSTHVIVGWRA